MQKQSFNQAWRFYLGDPFRFFGPPVDESTWRVLDLPHDWSIELERDPDNPSGVSNGWFTMGRGWYIKNFDAPEGWRGKKVLIEFEGVYMNAEAWLNDNFLGRHPYGYTTFTYDLTPYLKYGEVNRLRVRVDNSAQTNSRWYSGSGIFRPVWLIVAEPLHIAHWGVSVTTPEVSSESALVRIRTLVQNESEASRRVTIHSSVFDPDGAQVGKAESPTSIQANGSLEVDQTVQVASPRLWSPETPDLYRLATEVIAGSVTLDTADTTFGIRSISVDAERGFLLNGMPMKLKGGCVHHDNGVLGAASYSRSEERKVELHKANGYNAIRCAHNPPAPSFLDACDRLGVLVIDEAFDCWREGKNPFDYHVSFDDWWQRDIESMVCRDRNHPSVVAWSIGNEVAERDGRSGGARIARDLADAVRKLDPTRLITCAICNFLDASRWVYTDVVFAALDIGGYNYMWRAYQSDHERHPQRVMMGTESFPLEALDNWQQVEDHSYVIGDFVWTSLDYLGESGIGRQHYDGENMSFLGPYPWHQAYCGDLDLCGFKRPQSYYRDMVWGGEKRGDSGGKLYIAVHYPIPEGKTPTVTLWGWPDVGPNWTWPGQEGVPFKVDVYSACERVELFLNGQSLGTQPTTRAEKLTATFEVPYQPGELKAVGYTGGQKEAETALYTTGAPTDIRLTPDRSTISAEAGSLSYVTVEVVDAQGRMQPNASNNIFFTVKGEGAIAALGSGDPANTDRYRGNQHTVFRGRCLVVLMSNGKPGKILLRAQADGLESAAVIIQARA
jgi:beta-galactosidase